MIVGITGLDILFLQSLTFDIPRLSQGLLDCPFIGMIYIPQLCFLSW